MAGGHNCGRDAWRDARAPRVAASNARLVSSPCVPPAKRLFGNGCTQTALTTTEKLYKRPEKMSSLQTRPLAAPAAFVPLENLEKGHHRAS